MTRISIPLFLVLAVVARGQTTRQTTPIAITHARIIDGRGGSVIPDGSIILNGTRIDSVGSASSVSVPPGARIIDGRGKTVFPGLADMHVHLVGGWDGDRTDVVGYQRYLNALLYAGVTTVLDTDNLQPYILQLRQEIAHDRLIGPRIYCAGALIDAERIAFNGLTNCGHNKHPGSSMAGARCCGLILGPRNGRRGTCSRGADCLANMQPAHAGTPHFFLSVPPRLKIGRRPCRNWLSTPSATRNWFQLIQEENRVTDAERINQFRSGV